jgi:hypothetical protein
VVGFEFFAGSLKFKEFHEFKKNIKHFEEFWKFLSNFQEFFGNFKVSQNFS